MKLEGLSRALRGQMFDIVLMQPEIPPNTGNVIRLAANVGANLHLIEPLGFALDHAKLRRAGLDYHEFVRVSTYPNLAEYQQRQKPERLYAFSTLGRTRYDQVNYGSSVALLFGPETRGLGSEFLATLDPSQVLRLPMRPGNRSLNLSNAVAVAAFEVWRQQGFVGSS